MHVEQEIKIPVADLEPVRTRLSALVGVPAHAAALEENWVLDGPAAPLVQAGELLRVRRWGDAAWLTFKGPARFSAGVKSREEIEIRVADHAALLEILARIGFTVLRRYQKRREVWRALASEIALDLTPMGAFVEIEGEPGTIRRAASDLGLDLAAAVEASYVQLWAQYRVTHPDAPEDMLFP